MDEVLHVFFFAHPDRTALQLVPSAKKKKKMERIKCFEFYWDNKDDLY